MVIVLAFVVLLTGISFAIFTRAMSERKISNSSGNQTKVTLLADGALATILADLDAEIIQNSTTETVGTGKLYLPNSAVNVVPQRQSDVSDALPNLIARSASGKGIYDGGVQRASAESTKTPSQNGRYFSPARWNAHYLLPKETPSSDTDATPVSEFTVPDWILVDKKGGNPTSPNKDVVGRYAYAIYDEGGLLDLNVAGYPTALATATSPNGNASQRGSLAFADLKQLTESPDGTGTPLLTDTQIDAIVGRRNFVSASINTETDSNSPLGGNFPNFTFSNENADNYRRYALYNQENFLTARRKNSLPGDQYASDRMFLSRQELISFLLNGVATSAGERANMQTALQYFTQFTRDINQPSVTFPGTGSISIKSGYGNDARTTDTSDTTGVNPNFLKVRRTQAVATNNSIDYTPAKAGDPIVKKRFPLSRIAWLTFKGPIADSSGSLSSDPDIQDLIKAYKKAGLTEEFLKMGTPQNIKNAFGLAWGPADPTTLPRNAPPGGNVWVYKGLASASVADNDAKTLSQVASTDREPDFFELLKASVVAGGLTRASTNGSIPNAYAGTDPLSPPLKYQSNQDQSAFLAVMQLGANIIDQFDPDGYPTMINVSTPVLSSTSQKKLVSGVENLPYIYRVRLGMVMLAQANPPTPNNQVTYKANGSISETGGNDSTVVDNSPPLTATGVAACILIPDVWNPANPDSSVGTPAPIEFRIVADSINPDDISDSSTGSYTGFNMLAWKNGRQYWSDAGYGPPAFPFSMGFTGNWNRRLSKANSVLRFSTSGTNTIFQDPTILYMGGKPTGSNLTLANYAISSDLSSYCPPQNGVYGFKNVGTIDTNTHPGLTSQDPIIGFPIGVVPLRYVGDRVSNTTHTLHASLWATNQGAGGHPSPNTGASSVTFRLQYLRPGAASSSSTSTDWITYDTKYVDARVQTLAIPQGTVPTGPIQGYTVANTFVDPRTPKFGAFYTYFWTPITGGARLLPPANAAGEWLNGGGQTISDRSGSAADYNLTTPDWSSVTGTGFATATPVNPGLFGQNLARASGYLDSDGVMRPSMGSYATGTVGLPTATATQKNSRPVMLNRPFRSVGELGYVFSGMPWRNIDFSHPQSAFSALLDVFCINPTTNEDGMVAGKVNLNTRQAPVLKAILAGAFKNAVDLNPSLTDNSKAISPGLAAAIATRLTDRTLTKPFQNISELVGRYVSGDGNNDGDFDGFAKDLFGNSVSGSTGLLRSQGTPEDGSITGFGESAIRALADVGTTRVWNLMIDLVAQTGKYPPNSAKFVVEGEQRYWAHVAIDRLTGEVIDQKIEIVKE